MLAALALAVAFGLAGCATKRLSTTPSTSPAPRTAKELLAVASIYNRDFTADNVVLVYARWDRPS